MEHSGVLLLFFDLPNKDAEEKRNYRQFVKFLKQSGFARLQESVYVMLQRSVKSTSFDVSEIKRHVTFDGNVMVLPLTMVQFSKIITIAGDGFDVSFLCDDVVVV